MRLRRVVVPMIACASLLSGVAGTAGATPPVPPVLQAARKLVAVQTEVMTLRQGIPAARALVATRLGERDSAREQARNAVRTARDAHRDAQLSARIARRATARQEATAGRAIEATGDLKRLARQMYITGTGNTEIELFVGFAVNGPPALSAIANRDRAMNNAGTESVVVAERTAAAAERARIAAEQARAEFDTAHAADLAAASQLREARRAKVAAGQAWSSAQRALEHDVKSLAQAQDEVAGAQRAYDEATKNAVGSGGPPISPGNQGPLVWSMLVADGFSEQSAAAILGNFQQESGIDPTSVQAGGPGRGLAQWSQGGRWDNGPNSLLAFAKANDLKPLDTATQVRFAIYEMEHVLTGFDIDSFKQQTDVLAATVYFHDIFEASADSAAAVIAVRGGYAQQWYQALAG